MGAILSPKYERGKTYVLHQLETRATLCTIENTLVVPPLLVLYVPSVFPEGPRLSRGVSSTKPANSERVSAGLEGAASIHCTARRAIVSAISARFTAARSKA